MGVRQDVGEALIADFEVVQNRTQADGERRFHIPSWPQPGLVPRDPSRGVRIETIEYKGFAANLHPEFAGAAWRASLEAQGLRWRVDAVAYEQAVSGPLAPPAETFAALAWNDFRDVDLVLAVRPSDRRLHPRKPAAKLYNAWHAGVPALLGPECAYRELRVSDLDYIEVSNRGEAEAAIRGLRADPGRYQMMIDTGRRRAEEFTVGRIADQWKELLIDVAATTRERLARRALAQQATLAQGGCAADRSNGRARGPDLTEYAHGRNQHGGVGADRGTPAAVDVRPRVWPFRHR